MPTSDAARGDPSPQRLLGGLPTMALVVGSMLGVGIFIMPPQVASRVDGSVAFIGMWILGGLSALFGALCLAELGAMMPRSGGDYEFLRLGWGRGIAFAAGWLQLLVIFPGSLASVAVAVATYQVPTLVGAWAGGETSLWGLSTPQWVAAALIVGLTGINLLGVRIAGWVQVGVTSIPIVLLFLTSIYLLSSGGLPLAAPDPVSTPTHGATDYGQAFLKVYFAYSGWNAALFVAGEVRNPGRNLPRAFVGGTALVTGLYVVLCLGFLAAFGFVGLANIGDAGITGIVDRFGPSAVVALAFLILLAMLGSLNGTILVGSRIAFAMAQRGDCPAPAGSLHPKSGTPHIALKLQAAIALGLIVSPFDLEQLINYTSSAMLITGTLTVLTVVVFRRRDPHAERPYRATFHPVPALGYAACSVVVLTLVLVDGDPSVLVAVGWFTVAWAAWWLRHRKNGDLADTPAG